MKTKRSNIFETNSSSVHAIVVKTSGKVEIPKSLPEVICFSEGELDFGWEQDTYNTYLEKLAYLYSATIHFEDLRPILLRYSEEVGIHVLTSEGGDAEGWCGIDHCDEFTDIRKILKDLDSFKQFVFCPGSFITTGNDNSSDEAEVYRVLREYSDNPEYTVYEKDN